MIGDQVRGCSPPGSQEGEALRMTQPRLGTQANLGPVLSVRLRAIRSAHHDVERRPRWTLAKSAEEFTSCLLPVRELVVRIPAPRGDHGKNEDPALTEQFLISVRIALADIFGDMGEVELDGPAATRLKIDEQQSGLRAEHVA